MLVYKSVACQVEDHFYIGIQCNILWIIKDSLIAGTDAVIFVHAFTMIHCISPEENWQCSVIRIIKDRKSRQFMGGTVTGTGCRTTADAYISCKTGKKDSATGTLLPICISLGAISLDNGSRFCGGIADRQLTDGVSWDTGDLFTPFRCLWNTVCFAH